MSDGTLYNSDYCCNVELLNTYFKKNITLTAALWSKKLGQRSEWRQ